MIVVCGGEGEGDDDDDDDDGCPVPPMVLPPRLAKQRTT